MLNQAIQEYATKIKIPFLVHFTRVENLPSIMKYGLYPISRIPEIGVVPKITDEQRLDGHLDGISLSIAFPNYKMFFKYREREKGEWVILVIHPQTLWLKRCAFCKHNAADSRIISQPIKQLMTLQAFSNMYEEIEGIPSRKEQMLKSFDPTDSQAEVLVFDIINPNLIIGAAFQDTTNIGKYRHLFGNRKILIYPEGKGFYASRPYMRKE